MGKELNSGTIRNGLLDEALDNFRIVSISDNVAAVMFQFESGGLSLSFRGGMSMSEVANQFERAAERVRGFQKNGWPQQKITIHGEH